MSTATMTRPSAPTAPSSAPITEVTARDKVTATLVIGAASAATLGIFAWAVWVASQINIPI